MHISEPRVNSTLINSVVKVYELEWRPLRAHRIVLTPLKSNSKNELWTRIFHVRFHSIGETRFYLVKNLFWKIWSRYLFYFILKGKIKQEKRTLKKWLHSFWKNVSLKNPSLGPGIRLLIGKVPLKGSIPLIPTKVSLTKLREMRQLIDWLRVPR